MPVNGQRRARFSSGPSATATSTSLDRTTGEVLVGRAVRAREFVEGRRPRRPGGRSPTPRRSPGSGQSGTQHLPDAAGAKDWHPSAFSPSTGLVYIPHINLCMDWQSVEVNYIAGTPYVGANVQMYAGPGGNRGVFDAWDPVSAARRGASRRTCRLERRARYRRRRCLLRNHGRLVQGGGRADGRAALVNAD